MAEEIVLKTTLDTSKTESNTKSLKRELREAQVEAQNLGKQFGEFDKRTQAAARRAAELRDKLDDVNDAVKSFTGAGRIEAFTRAAAGAAGAFQAAIGAMQLFGHENEAVGESLKKLQAAMALTQGLQALEDMPRAFRQLYTSITTSTVAVRINDGATKAATATMGAFGVATEGTGLAFTALKGAIISTGIGALVVGIGLAVNALIEWAGASKDSEEAQKKLNEEIDKGAEKTKQYYAGQKLRIEAMKDGIEKEKALVHQDFQEQLAELGAQHGKKQISIEEFNRRKQYLLDIEANKTAAIEKKYSSEQQKKDEEAAKKRLEIQKAYQEQQKALLEKGLQMGQEIEKLANETIKDETERKKAQLQTEFDQDLETRRRNGTLTAEYEALRAQKLAMDLADVDQLAADKKQKREEDAAAKREQSQQAEYNSQKNLLNQLVADDQLSFEERFSLLNDFHEKGKISATDYADAYKKLEEEKAQAAMSNLMAVGGALSTFANLAGQQAEFGKGLAVAGAVINTFAGANKALEQTGIFGTIAAAGIIANGLANVASILATPVPKSPFGGGGGGFSTPSISAPAVQPIITQTAIQQTTPIETVSKGNQRVYVVESDITKTQNRVNVLQNRGSVG